MGDNMKKIVITGATSFIGVHLIKEWIKSNCEIYAIVRPNSSNIGRIIKDNKIHIIEADMNDYARFVNEIPKADFFYHLAWEGARRPYRDDVKIQKKNYAGAVNAMKLAEKLKCNFFLGSGSQAEYGVTNGLVDEDYPCHPDTEYGREKLHAYETLNKMAYKSGIKFIWTRIFSIYGRYDYSGTLIMSSLRKMKNDESIEMTEGTQLWDYLHVVDAAKAMKLFAQTQCDSGIYIVAYGDYKPLNQFVREMKIITESKSELKFGSVPYGSAGPVNLMPNSEKIQKTLNWKPMISFTTGIKDIYENM